MVTADNALRLVDAAAMREDWVVRSLSVASRAATTVRKHPSGTSRPRLDYLQSDNSWTCKLAGACIAFVSLSRRSPFLPTHSSAIAHCSGASFAVCGLQWTARCAAGARLGPCSACRRLPGLLCSARLSSSHRSSLAVVVPMTDARSSCR